MAISCGSFVILTDLRSKDGIDGNKQKDKYSIGNLNYENTNYSYSIRSLESI